MKLIDLLVQELPKRGSWPKTSRDIQIITGLFPATWHKPSHIGVMNYMAFSTQDREIVDIEQYEAALAASQQPAWNGEGLPPVGCECEYNAYDRSGDNWKKVKILYSSTEYVIAIIDGYESSLSTTPGLFRSLCTEAERKRDEATHAMASAPKPCGHAIYGICCEIYDAIAAGKIPYVKLETN